MHAMSHRSDFFVFSCRVNNQEPTVCFTVSLPSEVLDSKSLNTSLLEVMISSKNECVIIFDLSDCTLPIIFNA